MSDENRILISLPAYFDYRYINEVEHSWDEIFLRKPESICIDFFAVKLIDSTAIGKLIKLFKQSNDNNIKFHFFNVNSDIVKIFETTKINSFISVKPKVEPSGALGNEP